MRLVLLSLVVAALVLPTAGLADGSSSSRSGSSTATKASAKKKPKQRSAKVVAAKRTQIRAAKLKTAKPKAAKQSSSSAKAGGSSSSSSSAGEVEVKGAITALSATSVTVGTQTCAIPTGMTLTGFAVNDVVELKCKLVAGLPTVVKVENEDDGQQGDPQGEAEVKGPITARSATSVTVGALTCTVPAGMSLGSLTVNDLVEMECLGVAGIWTLKEIEREDDDAGQSGSDDGDDDDDHSSSGDDDSSGSGSGGDDD